MFSRAVLGCQLHTSANTAPIFWYSTEEEENLGFAIACCYAGLQVVMLKGQGTPIVWLYQSQADWIAESAFATLIHFQRRSLR